MDDWDYTPTEDDYWTDTGNETNTDTYQPTYDYSPTPEYNMSTPQTDQSTVMPDWYSNMMGNNTYTETQQQAPSMLAQLPPEAAPNVGIGSFLQNIFGGGNAGSMLKLVGALAEGNQNKQKANALTQAAAQQQAASDPWAAQRPFYQTQAKQAVTNPYDSPIVSAQIAQLQKAQNIKDAAAGRRSNSLMGSTAVLSDAAKIAQAYQAQMAAQGGANLTPTNTSNLAAQAANYSTNGYMSPLLNALGYTNQASTNANTLANLTQQQKAALAKQWASA